MSDSISIEHVRFSSHDADEIGESVAPVAKNVRVEAIGRGIEAEIEGFAIPGLAAFDVECHDLRVVTSDVVSYCSITVPVRSSLDILDDGHSRPLGPGEAHILEPHQRFDLKARDAVKAFVVNVDLDLICPPASRPGGESAQRFSGCVDLDAGPGASLRRHLEFIRQEIRRSDSALRTPLVATQAAKLLAGLMAESAMPQPARANRRLVPGRTVSRAEEYLVAHLAGPVSAADVAAFVGVSVRSLSRAFHEARGVGPMRFLRDRRFEATHHALRVPASETLTVTEVALNHGFGQLGRFAVEYRKRYGESPSTTLAGGLGRDPRSQNPIPKATPST